MRALVTGGAGFIGSHVAERFVQLGLDVTVVDDLSSGSIANVPAGVTFERLDVASPEMGDWVRRWAPDLVVHCAAQASVPRSQLTPDTDALTNIVGTIRALEGARAAGAVRFVYMTTGGALYGVAERIPTSEDEPIRPISPYGLSKWVAEQYLALLGGDQMRSVVLRLANVYGPRQRTDGEGGVVSTFISRMAQGAQVEIHGDGEQTRDFVFVGDVVDAVVAACGATEPLVANIGTGISTSVNHLVELLSSITEFTGPVVYTDSRSGDVRDSCLDAARAWNKLGWRPATSLESGLRLTARSMLERSE